MVAYGADAWSARLDEVFGKFFETEVRVFAVSSGTAANSLAIATFCPPWGTVLTHAEAHIERDECGAPEFFTGGAKLSLVGGGGAKISAPDLLARLAWFEPHVHGVQPRMLSITQATERGAVYSPREIRAVADIAHERQMAVHMDGARSVNALVAQNVSPADLSWKAGVDVLSFGVIKNGGMNAEAVVFFDRRAWPISSSAANVPASWPARAVTLRCSSRVTSRAGCGGVTPNAPTGWRRVLRPRRRTCSANPSRPTRYS